MERKSNYTFLSVNDAEVITRPIRRKSRNIIRSHDFELLAMYDKDYIPRIL